MRLAAGLVDAFRCDARPLPRVRSSAGRAGLAFEKHVAAGLKFYNLRLEHNPWFAFTDRNGRGQIVPDYLAHLDGDIVLLIECKLKFPELAPLKVQNLYVPILTKALNKTIVPLIICKYLTPEAKIIVRGLSEALSHSPASVPTLQWLERGDIPW